MRFLRTVAASVLVCAVHPYFAEENGARGGEEGGRGTAARLQVEYSVTHNKLIGARKPRALFSVSVSQQEATRRMEPKRGVVESHTSMRRATLALDQRLRRAAYARTKRICQANGHAHLEGEHGPQSSRPRPEKGKGSWKEGREWTGGAAGKERRPRPRNASGT